MKHLINTFLFFSTIVTVLGAPGDLDLSFGNGGIVVTPINDRPYRDYEVSQTMLVQPDGKILICGTATDSNGNNADRFFLARYHSNGTLDTTFGANGIVRSPDRPGHLNLFDIALQADGKIIGVGEGFDVSIGYGAAVYRFNTNGSLDASFGMGGVAITPGLILFGLATQPNGKIVGVGNIGAGFVVVRYNQDGSLDATFGVGGIVATAIGNDSSAHKAIIQPDEKVLAVGSLTTFTDNTASNRLAMSRYNPDGSLDVGFGTGGKLVDADLTVRWSPDAVLQTDGKIVVPGYVNIGNGKIWNAGLVRYKPDGSQDTSFGQNGICRFENNLDVSGALAVQSDGKLVAFGAYSEGFAIVRVNSSGTLDTNFGINGKVTTPVGSHPDTSLTDGAVQPDGKILAYGATYRGWYDDDIAIIRYQGTSQAPFDYDGDGRTDLSVYRPSEGNWYVMKSGGGIDVTNLDNTGVIQIVPADYDGDGKTDKAVFAERVTTLDQYTVFEILSSSSNTVSETEWGWLDQIPVPADYNGDQTAEIATYKQGTWHRREGGPWGWGILGDKPVPADFNGDGAADMTVFRPSNGGWYTLNSGDASISINEWGLNGDLPVPGDYSGDGKADFCVFRPSNQTWYRRDAETNQIHIITWGLPGDLPVPGDYDGDAKNDLAVFRPSNSTWYIFGSTSGIYSQPFGLTGDIPTPNAFVY